MTLAMMGAQPAWLSAGFVLEEGLPLDVLDRIVRAMADAARSAGVQLITGDTKVVERGKAGRASSSTRQASESAEQVSRRHPAARGRVTPSL